MSAVVFHSFVNIFSKASVGQPPEPVQTPESCMFTRFNERAVKEPKFIPK